uniref:Uncharacterized protein n=1 Tax=Chromera velia CCMP2878 TaxID=1169474 RepID=A0A0G4HFK3_9ALVE|eukprot:Cvel_6671.t1-p1 / transcript=Cvel_6671.t1 / gene=Cvel_6671 / organism=Chromera_velia_CCMP2878 / gene_product=hypothetical protein / transcript_product=hypothetical protein / location=Cvel_scaffold331:66778-67398(+) / protein_length=207 / sequence_SO=supercontig / SO=protein_coding / is_pseudo=false
MCVQSVDPLKHPVLFRELHALLGCLHFDPDRIDDRSQDVDQAEFHLENAVRGDDHLVRGSELFKRCHFRLGLIKKFHRKDRETARERFVSALVGAPPAPTQDVQTACAHFHIGGLLEDEGRKPSDIFASEHLCLSLETGFPSPLVAHAELARIKHRKLGRAAEAVEHYRAALPLRRFDLVFGLGEVLEALEGPRKCEDEVARLKLKL